MKVKFFKDEDFHRLEDTLNAFSRNHSVIDIKITSQVAAFTTAIVAMVIYQDVD